MQEVKINTPFAYELLICVGNRDVTFWAHHKKNDEFLCITTSDYQALQNTIDNSVNISEEFSGVKIVYGGTDMSIVPTPVFNPDEVQNIYALTHTGNSNETLLNTALIKNNATILFPVNKEIHQLLVDKFNGAEVYHELGVLLDTINQHVGYCLNVRLNKGKIMLAVTNNNKLVLANTYNYSQPEDAVYFVLNACEQLNIDPATVKGNIINITDKFWNTVLLIQDYCPEIKTVNVTTLPEFENTDAENGLLLFNLAKCE